MTEFVFNAVFAGNKTCTMCKMKIEYDEHGVNTVFVRKPIRGLFRREKWLPALQNFGDLMKKYVELQLFDVEKGLQKGRVRLFHVDYTDLTERTSMLPAEALRELEDKNTMVALYKAKHSDKAKYVQVSANNDLLDAELAKKARTMRELLPSTGSHSKSDDKKNK